ncbi:MAG: glycosyltransferase family 2 protein [Candidatus Omnitrophica bacterium]|nr:glycosyltransferase family 2 protein [Candidatus Omnitrophota bacterium]
MGAVGTDVEVSVVIPAYNEEKNIYRALKEIGAYFGGKGTRAEYIVVDDGSRDGTLEESRKAARALGLPVSILESAHEGKGSAVRRGMLQARGERVLFCDADMATPIEEFEKFERVLDTGADVVIGSRKTRGAQILKRQPILREWLGRGFTAITNLLLGVRVSDVTCGFKCFQRHAIQPLFSRQRLSDWSFDAEILYLAARMGFKVREVPVRWRDSGVTHVRLMRDIVGSLVGLVKIRILHP